MRIAFVSTIFSYPWGGADALWTASAELALQRGDKVLVAIGAETARHPRIEALKKNGAEIHIRQMKPMAGGRLSFITSLKWRLSGGQTLTDALRTWNPERVIFSQGGPIDYLQELETLRALSAAKIPYEFICQSNSDWFSVPSDSFKVSQEWAASARRFWFVSNQNRQLAETQFAMNLGNAKIIQNPMELRNTQSIPWPASPPWSFAVVARFDAVCKGLDLLFPALAETLKDEPWNLSLYGRGRDEVYLRELAKYAGVENNIHFVGYTDSIRNVWEKHHMLLLPSRFEGCALAMLEAMACGRPILATAVGGAEEWIRDKVDGFICPSPTRASLSETLAGAWSMRERWPEMGASAGERFASLRDPSPQKALLEDFS